jgi:hypothetical protein
MHLIPVRADHLIWFDLRTASAPLHDAVCPAGILTVAPAAQCPQSSSDSTQQALAWRQSTRNSSGACACAAVGQQQQSAAAQPGGDPE